MTAEIFFDFDLNMFCAMLPNGAQGHGSTPNEAVENLRFQANKHDLWPKMENKINGTTK